MSTFIIWKQSGSDSPEDVDDTHPLPVNPGTLSSTGTMPDVVLIRTGNTVIKSSGGNSTSTAATGQVSGATYTVPTGYQSKVKLAVLTRVDAQAGSVNIRFRYTANGQSAQILTSEDLPPTTIADNGAVQAYHTEPIQEMLLAAGDMVEFFCNVAVTSSLCAFYMGIEETVIA